MMTKKEGIKALKKLKKDKDTEYAHRRADEILLALIDDYEVDIAFNAIEKWYS